MEIINDFLGGVFCQLIQKDLPDIEQLYFWKHGPDSHGLKAQWLKKNKTKQRKGEQYTVFSAY